MIESNHVTMVPLDAILYLNLQQSMLTMLDQEGLVRSFKTRKWSCYSALLVVLLFHPYRSPTL